MKRLIGESKKKRVAIVDSGGDEAVDKCGSSIGSKERMKSVNFT